MTNNTYYNQKSDEGKKIANTTWLSNGYSACIPGGVALTVEEITTNAPLQSATNDYIASMVPKFIMGPEELTRESFDAFVKQVRS